ncbi:LOW QUALITY PROTEIN: nuclear speckle splicing regulatory protein 1 [Danaus plexippus]|uniref:LOW QUALITY PROTEIN: nuclear speckle splicing regulatory protein 1 n=1 Tax=Danaus plexippus TaxID=13037 RepID=UPI002AB05807|nr:LOW QUALITY PROTEIN: nuclear speckle splicing regulatory protein 1 [Danaus plexippus]
MAEKQYGLILKDKTKGQLSFQSSRNVFGSDSDSGDEKQKAPLSLKPSSNINRQAKITQEKALGEDPTVYQYDEIYDSMIKEKEAKKRKQLDKKPKYIENLIKSSNKRKLENERRIERQIQKEREKEGEEFADKEVFVTSAYKKKLEEMRIEEEKEKYEEYLESIGDVTKQQDLGGFYRHLYEQKLGSKKSVETDKKNDPLKEGSPEPKHTEFTKTRSKDDRKGKESKQRNYRKRKASHEKLSEGEIEDSEGEINHCNLDDIRTLKKSKQDSENIDADSDFSIDDSSDEESNKEIPLPQQAEVEKSENDSKKLDENKTPPINNEKPKTEIDKPKEKIDIWKKRTVGEVFEQALKRYYERKAARGAH